METMLVKSEAFPEGERINVTDFDEDKHTKIVAKRARTSKKDEGSKSEAKDK